MPYIIKDKNEVSLLQMLQLVCSQNHRLAFEETSNAILKQMFAYMRVHCRQWIIEQIHISVLVYSPVCTNITTAQFELY
jgi:hypothetical protein